MPIRIDRTKATALLLLVPASLAAAACGSSSGSSSSTTHAAATVPNSTARGEQAGGRLASLSDCLRKNGIPLPQGASSARPGVGGLFSGGRAVQLPPGVTPAQYQAALKKCGAPNIAGRPARARGPVSRAELLKSPAFKQALTTFAACMRGHGVKLPAPNTSGEGSVFNTKGLNTKSPKFVAALSACRSDLASASRLGGPP